MHFIDATSNPSVVTAVASVNGAGKTAQQALAVVHYHNS